MWSNRFCCGVLYMYDILPYLIQSCLLLPFPILSLFMAHDLPSSTLYCTYLFISSSFLCWYSFLPSHGLLSIFYLHSHIEILKCPHLWENLQCLLSALFSQIQWAASIFLLRLLFHLLWLNKVSLCTIHNLSVHLMMEL